MPKKSVTRELRRKLRDFSDTLKHVQLIAIDNYGKHIEIADVDIQEMKANIKDLDAPGTSRFWVDDQNYLGSLVPITKRPERPEPKPKLPPTPQPTQPMLPLKVDTPSYKRPERPEPKPKLPPTPQPILPPKVDTPSYIGIFTRAKNPPAPEPPKPRAEGGIWCYYCKIYRMPDPYGKCVECRSQLIYD